MVEKAGPVNIKTKWSVAKGPDKLFSDPKYAAEKMIQVGKALEAKGFDVIGLEEPPRIISIMDKNSPLMNLSNKPENDFSVTVLKNEKMSSEDAQKTLRQIMAESFGLKPGDVIVKSDEKGEITASVSKEKIKTPLKPQKSPEKKSDKKTDAEPKIEKNI